MTLFPEVDNCSSEPRAYNESRYDFFSRVCDRLDMEDARDRLELWFSHLTRKERTRIRQAMSRGSDAHFDACFFELFLHEFLLASGCKPEIHTSRDGQTRTPDFDVSSATGAEFLTEAVVVTDKPNAERSREKLQGQILDMLNSLSSPYISFAISELVVKSSQLPSLRNLKEFVMSQIAAASDGTEFLRDATWKYEDKRVKLVVRPIFHNEETWSSNVRSGPVKVRWGGPETAIAAKLKKKATWYGKIEKPFVIAVNIVSEWTNSLESVTGTLLGIPEELILQAEGVSAMQEHLDSESFWYKDGVPQHRTVSAVLATRMFPWSVLRASVRLYHNPHARYPLPDNVFRVEQVTRDLVLVAGSNLQEILG